MDRFLWWTQLAEALALETVEQSTWKNLTQKGSSNEYESGNLGWLRHEFVRTFNTKSNPTSSKLVKMYPNSGDAGDETKYDDSTNLQRIEVRNSDGDLFDFGTHYTIKFNDGSILLTAAGVTRLSTHTLQAKYTYSTNVTFWNIVPPSGTQGFDNLRNLRRAVGRSKQKIVRRNYEPNYLGISTDIEDLISNAPNLTVLGGNEADALDRYNEIIRYTGLAPVTTTALDSSAIIVGQKGSVRHYVHVPWNMWGPDYEATTGNPIYFADQFSGTGTPEPRTLSAVLILGLDDLNEAVAA
jgi:hypothetical protein